MRWFRGHAEAPRLLSLSPLQADEDLDGASYHFHVTSQYRDMSPVRWTRRKSSSSESERNCYNVQTSRVTTERTPNKKEKKKIQEERRRICEKRHPLLDRVKNTRLTFFKDRDSDEDEENEENEENEDDEVSDRMQFRSMYELSQRGLTRNEFRRSVCENDLKDITEEERIRAKRKRRSKSQNRLVSQRKSQHQEDRYSFLGLQTSTPENLKHSVLPSETYNDSHGGPRLSRWRKSKEKDLTEEEDRNQEDQSERPKEGFDSITPSSCLAAKFRAMQDRYLKSSTSKLIAKIYKKDNKECKDGKDKRRLRSFSYGTLPGLEELRTNPLYEDQDQDDNDSGILDNDSATSSLLDDRCSSGASGLMTSQSSNNDSPPRLPPRKPSTSIMDADRTARFFSALDIHCVRTDGKACTKDILTFDPNDDSSELIGEESRSENSKASQLPVIRSKAYITETMVVKLFRETPDQCLGIFIAKTAESSPGYLVAHVVPNGLADKEGTLKIGDEILIVNGRRLRGLSMAEARKILGNGSGPGEVDIVVSRYSGVDHAKKLKESSVDYENVSIENGHGVIVEDSPRSRFKKHQAKHHRDRKNESGRSIISDKTILSTDNNGSATQLQTQSVSNFCTLPRRPRSTVSTFLTVLFEKGPGKKSLGFTIVGGKDSPKGSIGIFIKSVLPSGQAAEDGRLRAGDEILAVNGQVCHDLTHREAVQLFRHIKSGPVALHLCRRIKNREPQATKAKSCADLLLVDT
ncbi:uncharacterized protein LOC122634373 isoform X1 [Vespula pensylvanica]|uniref:uncharacterized protein LOC122634373 isoform X1 n=1 Tax=Vespula pensylvanica TaxID=30213 RepID=UPI001CBA246D|nr:uncharacterized protein LOC122634373 isoform X1 [Vespula pensylvanica]